MLWPFITLASAAAASYAGYATMSPASQLYGRTLTHGSDPNQMALTFDDGPNDPHTMHLLDMLARHNAKATFFLIGKYVRLRPEIARAILAAGHEIGNHTHSHPNLALVSATRLRQELEDCSKALEDALGTKTTLFRPPFGGRRPNVLRTARKMGLSPIMWSVTAYDWSAKSPEAIVKKAAQQIDSRRKPQSEVVLLHDGGHQAFGTDRSYTVEATRLLLERYAAKQFVTISGLRLSIEGVPIERLNL
ncbi:MAG TPA: polysaccharide deacetylase family protein [Candidatus Angelobacter sp.]|jgi:peptidoglycan/xylan/chitin deacetylase (PgdA/CDA1 family)|nr:polysaccharide deacetylase family protein [Candidatus Angelobacter sp.]